MGLVGVSRKNKMKNPPCHKLTCWCKLVGRNKQRYATDYI